MWVILSNVLYAVNNSQYLVVMVLETKRFDQKPFFFEAARSHGFGQAFSNE